MIRIEPYGALVFSKKYTTTIRMDRQEAETLLGYTGDFPEGLTAPEVVHLEVSSRCNVDCDYCYVDKDGEELQTGEWKKIISELSRNGVTQVTFGGGEPTIRNDIDELINKANSLKMGTAVTTNGKGIDGSEAWLSSVDQINFSYHGNLDDLVETILEAKNNTNVGMNFVLSDFYQDDLGEVGDFCKENRVELLILTYKPVNGDDENHIPPKEVLAEAERLSSEGVPVAVDGLTCGRCTGSERFIDIDSKGNVFPCSFVRESMGNALKENFHDIWKNRQKLESCPFSNFGGE